MTTKGERFNYIRTQILNLTQVDFAKKLNIKQQTIADIERDKIANIHPNILEILCKEYLINLEWLLFNEGEPTKLDTYESIEHDLSGVNEGCGCCDVIYWEGLPNDLKRPQITSVHCDLELVESDWMRNPSNLRAVPVLGDSMNTYKIPLLERNMLIMDISVTDINKSGVYLFTTNQGKNLYIRFLSLNMDGSVKITAFRNNEEISKTLTIEEQKDYDFKVIGRILINASLTI